MRTYYVYEIDNIVGALCVYETNNIMITYYMYEIDIIVGV